MPVVCVPDDSSLAPPHCLRPLANQTHLKLRGEMAIVLNVNAHLSNEMFEATVRGLPDDALAWRERRREDANTTLLWATNFPGGCSKTPLAISKVWGNAQSRCRLDPDPDP